MSARPTPTSLERSTAETRRALAYAAVVGLALAAASGAALAETGTNPPAPGFDAEGSDADAIAVADSTMEAMGGRDAWDRTRYLTWGFFGQRFHVWDKHAGRARVEYDDRESGARIVAVVDLATKDGRAWSDGETIADAERRAAILEGAYRAWINDSYWLVMPYKLKDSGVTLGHAGEGTMEDGRAADVLQLTFRDVGVTPENKYLVFVAKDSGLVEQWDFYPTADTEEARFKTPWHGWERHGGILLSADRGTRGDGAALGHTNVAVLEDVPESVWTNPGDTGLFGTNDAGDGADE